MIEMKTRKTVMIAIFFILVFFPFIVVAVVIWDDSNFLDES